MIIKGIVAAMTLLFNITCFAQDLYVPVINVHDGDTIEVRLTLPEPLNKVSVRIYGIDTPEMPAKSYATTGKLNRAECIQEAELALTARDYVATVIKKNGNMLILRNFKYGKYGGRIVARPFVVNLETGDEIEIGPLLLKQEYAVEYFGGTKNKNWCE